MPFTPRKTPGPRGQPADVEHPRYGGGAGDGDADGGAPAGLPTPILGCQRGSPDARVTGVAVVNLCDVLNEVRQRPAVGGTRIIGVDGPSGSGKSTLARRLVTLSGAALVQIDDFVSWDDLSGWWPRFDQQVLDPLLGGQDAVYQVRDWAGDEFGRSLAGWKTVPWAPLIVLDGVTGTRRATVGRLTYAIWVEAPRAARLERGLNRDGHTDIYRDLWSRWMREEDRFFPVDGARDRADLRVDSASDVPHDPDTQVVTL